MQVYGGCSAHCGLTITIEVPSTALGPNVLFEGYTYATYIVSMKELHEHINAHWLEEFATLAKVKSGSLLDRYGGRTEMSQVGNLIHRPEGVRV